LSVVLGDQHVITDEISEAEHYEDDSKETTIPPAGRVSTGSGAEFLLDSNHSYFDRPAIERRQPVGVYYYMTLYWAMLYY
jgi:hypothetical protein